MTTQSSSNPNNQPQSLVKYSNAVLVSTAGRKSNKVLIFFIQDKVNPQNLASTYTEDILNSILPPREFTSEKQQLWYFKINLGFNLFQQHLQPNKMCWISNKN